MNLKEDNIRPFRSTAQFYSAYRLPYAPEVFGVLVEMFSLTKESRVLDVGAGVGFVAHGLAPYVREVVALDAESEMIEEGKRISEEKGMGNVVWKEGFAEDIDDSFGVFDVVTIGAAFHWLDQKSVLSRVMKVFEGVGGIVLLTNFAVGRWKDVIQKIVYNYLGEKRYAGMGFYERPEGKFEDHLQDAGFSNIETIEIPFEVKRTVDEVVGEVFSMSWASPFVLESVLGEKKEDFERDLRRELSQCAEGGLIRVEGVTEAIVGFKT